jgi:HTH-type transcriptional repressor of NAD biosynthesis genes
MMKYKCGIYCGSFNPLHLGHVRCIINAANQCETLVLVIANGVNRNEINIRARYRWLYEITKHLDNVRLLILEDTAPTKADYTEKYWYADAKTVLDFAGQTVNALFCGSDYAENGMWTACYPEAELVILPRDEISSTEIRNKPLAHWDWLPNVVKPYYAKKILIIGGESTGKSTLAINLARHFNTNYLEEVGRDISERSGTDTLMLPEDFTDILLQHKTREIEALKYSNRLLFEDTDCLTTLFYLYFLKSADREKNETLAAAIAGLNRYDLVIFLEPDVAFVQKGDRNEAIAADRLKYSEFLKSFYREQGFGFYEIHGNYQERFDSSVRLVENLLGGGIS